MAQKTGGTVKKVAASTGPNGIDVSITIHFPGENPPEVEYGPDPEIPEFWRDLLIDAQGKPVTVDVSTDANGVVDGVTRHTT